MEDLIIQHFKKIDITLKSIKMTENMLEVEMSGEDFFHKFSEQFIGILHDLEDAGLNFIPCKADVNYQNHAIRVIFSIARENR